MSKDANLITVGSHLSSRAEGIECRIKAFHSNAITVDLKDKCTDMLLRKTDKQSQLLGVLKRLSSIDNETSQEKSQAYLKLAMLRTMTDDDDMLSDHIKNITPLFPNDQSKNELYIQVKDQDVNAMHAIGTGPTLEVQLTNTQCLIGTKVDSYNDMTDSGIKMPSAGINTGLANCDGENDSPQQGAELKNRSIKDYEYIDNTSDEKDSRKDGADKAEDWEEDSQEDDSNRKSKDDITYGHLDQFIQLDNSDKSPKHVPDLTTIAMATVSKDLFNNHRADLPSDSAPQLMKMIELDDTFMRTEISLAEQSDDKCEDDESKIIETHPSISADTMLVVDRRINACHSDGKAANTKYQCTGYPTPFMSAGLKQMSKVVHSQVLYDSSKNESGGLNIPTEESTTPKTCTAETMIVYHCMHQTSVMAFGSIGMPVAERQFQAYHSHAKNMDSIPQVVPHAMKMEDNMSAAERTSKAHHGNENHLATLLSLREDQLSFCLKSVPPSTSQGLHELVRGLFPTFQWSTAAAA